MRAFRCHPASVETRRSRGARASPLAMHWRMFMQASSSPWRSAGKARMVCTAWRRCTLPLRGGIHRYFVSPVSTLFRICSMPPRSRASDLTALLLTYRSTQVESQTTRNTARAQTQNKERYARVAIRNAARAKLTATLIDARRSAEARREGVRATQQMASNEASAKMAEKNLIARVKLLIESPNRIRTDQRKLDVQRSNDRNETLKLALEKSNALVRATGVHP